MSMRTPKFVTIMNAKAVTGIGNVIDVWDFRNVVITVATASSGNLTVKCQGSIAETAPDFSAAATAANPWTYVQMIDLADGSSVAGATWIAAAGTDIIRTVEINENLFKWITFNVTARVAWSVTVTWALSDNL